MVKAPLCKFELRPFNEPQPHFRVFVASYTAGAALFSQNDGLQPSGVIHVRADV